MAKVTTPVEGFSGTVAGVDFKDGVGETDDPQALVYFTRHGYGVGQSKGRRAAKRAAPKASADE